MSYTPAIAETSKDDVLAKLAPDTKLVMEELTKSFSSSFFYVLMAVIMFVLMILALIIAYFVVMGRLTVFNGFIIFSGCIFATFALAYAFYTFFDGYCRKEFLRANKVFTNFIESEEVLTIIDGAAGVYLENL